ncbi:gastrula zinc finger protein XlCGF26.1-like isoform X1 [Ostrinia nubilalis]|uniref:gastrula zinc finger protein XlCGF26.1-like isoform X1 n=1 Tax=Ostrinia nubilalis TaxID=29057 RepID=UPI0030823DFA
MESKTLANYGQCRCCLGTGYHRDIMKEYFCNGIREVYFEIFRECYNLFLSTDANISTLICSSCVQRLREAISFRMMVVATEQQLLSAARKEPGDNQMTFVNVPVSIDALKDVEVKQEIDVQVIKEELIDVEPDNTDADPDYVPEDDHYSDEAEPTKPDNDLVEGEAKLLARFPKLKCLPTRQTLAKTCPQYVKQLDLLKGLIVLPSSLVKLLDNDNIRSKVHTKKTFVSEKMAHIVNASTLLEFSNITPFKSRSRSGFPCFYCRNLFENLDELREHTSEHKKSELRKVLGTYGAECLVVYADITDLRCTICNSSITNLSQLKTHLTKTHNKKMHLEYTDRVIPFKLSTDNVYECQMCGFSFETFGSIERHMNVHFRNYVCKDCGTGFVTKYRLKVHSKSMHVGGSFPCDICKKVFTTQQKQKNHVDTVHKMVKRFKCTKCPERFSEYFRRQKHMVEEHGVAPLQYKCNVCEKSFDRRYTLSRHMKRDHLEERDFQCTLCSYKCFTNNELRVHMIKHNGERIYECSVCKKSYARKKTLKEHMRIHNNDRRFSCAVCGQAFVQKCSLKGHLKTHHHEYGLQ